MKNKSKFLSTATAAALTAAGLLVVPLAPASAAPGQSQGQGTAWGKYLNVTSRAVANPAHRVALDSAAVWGPLRSSDDSPASATASAQANCSGCSAQATTLQVLSSAQAANIWANNTASAYTTGDWASSAAVSVQVVTATRSNVIMANNRALSVNEGCTGCASTTAALQYIIVGGKAEALSDAARSIVRQIEQQLGFTFQSDSWRPKSERSARARASANDAAERARAVIAADTGASVESRVDVDTED
ncbi:hypothetical protein [Sinomonas sp. B1-1]|uniref:hypothetical protein n=1 Tax=Sinomonas sp. B1-1 TaxID=3141454 RepID=UPI003D27D5C2